LDKNNRVVLIGAPTYNSKLWELYKTTITKLIENGGTLDSTDVTMPDLTEQPDHDLVTNDSLLRFEAPIANLGKMKIGQKKRRYSDSPMSAPIRLL
jgi:hypothetical protein